MTRRTTRRARWLVLVVLRSRGSRSGAPRSGSPADAGRSSAATPQLTGVVGGDAAGHAEAALDLRGRRRHRVVGGDRRRRVYVGVGDRRAASRSTSPTASCSGSTRPSTDGIGESSPAVAGGLVYIGDLAGVVHAVRRRDGKAAWTFKTGGEIKSSPVVAGDLVLIGSYDSTSTRSTRRTGKLRWKLQTDGYVHATPAVVDGVAYIAGCDEIFRGDPRRRRQGGATRSPSGAYTGASPVDRRRRAPTSARSTTRCSRVDLQARRRSSGATSTPTASFRSTRRRRYLGSRHRRRRARQAGARARRQTGKAAWTFATRARVDSSPVVAGGRVYVGSNDGKLYVLDAPAARACSSSRPAARCPRSPALASGPRHRLSRTASCSVSGLNNLQLVKPSQEEGRREESRIFTFLCSSRFVPPSSPPPVGVLLSACAPPGPSRSAPA